jgi:hypothetical protein
LKIIKSPLCNKLVLSQRNGQAAAATMRTQELLVSLLGRILPSSDACWCPCAQNPYLDKEKAFVLIVLLAAVVIGWWNGVLFS